MDRHLMALWDMSGSEIVIKNDDFYNNHLQSSQVDGAQAILT
jgi:hypothetical protein